MANTYDSENTFVALVDRNGFIRDMSVSRRGEIIGVDYQKEEEYKQTISAMQETIDNYYSKLVELNAIVIPKSPEQIAQEAAAEQLRLVQEQAEQQATINSALLSAIESLNSEFKELKSREHDGNSSAGIVKTSAKQSRSNSESDK